MQVFFCLATSGIGRDNWSKKKFNQIVTEYVKTLPNAQFNMLESTGWNSYCFLCDVENDSHALEMRKTIERLCKQVSAKCRPFYFRFRNKSVENISSLTMFGLTSEENKIFMEKAPPGVYREIVV